MYRVAEAKRRCRPARVTAPTATSSDPTARSWRIGAPVRGRVVPELDEPELPTGALEALLLETPLGGLVLDTLTGGDVVLLEVVELLVGRVVLVVDVVLVDVLDVELDVVLVDVLDVDVDDVDDVEEVDDVDEEDVELVELVVVLFTVIGATLSAPTTVRPLPAAVALFVYVPGEVDAVIPKWSVIVPAVLPVAAGTVNEPLQVKVEPVTSGSAVVAPVLVPGV